MAGPLSVPNGDPRLVRNEQVCEIHGEQQANCGRNCRRISLREYLTRRNALFTGKTQGNKR